LSKLYKWHASSLLSPWARSCLTRWIPSRHNWVSPTWAKSTKKADASLPGMGACWARAGRVLGTCRWRTFGSSVLQQMCLYSGVGVSECMRMIYRTRIGFMRFHTPPHEYASHGAFIRSCTLPHDNISWGVSYIPVWRKCQLRGVKDWP